MNPTPSKPGKPRILLHTLIGTLAIAGALGLRNSVVTEHRVGALLLLTSGLLFVLVVIVDWIKAARERGDSGGEPDRDSNREETRASAGPVIRRIRPSAYPEGTRSPKPRGEKERELASSR